MLRWSLEYEYVLSRLPSRHGGMDDEWYLLQTCQALLDCYRDVEAFLSLSPRSRLSRVLSSFDGYDVYNYSSDEDSGYSDSDDDSIDD